MVPPPPPPFFSLLVTSSEADLLSVMCGGSTGPVGLFSIRPMTCAAGRVKTLHPVIHGGILAIRTSADHMTALQQHAITPIDVVGALPPDCPSLTPCCFNIVLVASGVVLHQLTQQPTFRTCVPHAFAAGMQPLHHTSYEPVDNLLSASCPDPAYIMCPQPIFVASFRSALSISKAAVYQWRG